MTEEASSAGGSIGTARIDVTVNTDTMQAGVEAAKRKVSGLGDQAAQEFNKANASTKRYAESLLRQADLLGKTRAEQIAYNAQVRIGGELGDKIAAKALANQAKAASSLGATAKTAGELQFAMRSLPAQITDIFVGLSTGQRPLTVLLQQGGQLKDLFGGIGPAAKALGSSLIGLINPLTVAGGLLAGLGYSLYQVDAEAAKDRETLKGFQQGLNSTGNAAGETAQGLAALSEQLGHGAEQAATYGAVLKELVGGGFILGPSLGKVAKDVQSISDATGKTAGQVVADYQKIFKDPAAAAAELSQTIQFLSADQFALVQQLENTGEKGRAANIVISALNDALIGGTDSAEKYASKLAEISRQLDDIRNHPEKYNAGDLGGFSTSDALTSDLEAQRKQNVAAYVTASLNEQNRQLAAGARESIAAQRRLSAFASPQDKLNSTLAQANKDRLAALYGVVDPAARARIEAEYKQQVKAANDSFDSATKDRKSKPSVFGESIGNDPRADLTASISKEVDGFKKEAEQWARSTSAAAAYRQSLQDMLDTRQQAIDLQVASIGMGQREIAQQQALISIDEDYNRKKADLQKRQQNTTSALEREGYQSQLDDLERYHTQRIQMELDGWRREDEARKSAALGARAALADFTDAAGNVAGQTQNLFSNAFDGMTDAIAKFVQTGKLDFSDLASSIIADLAKMEARILVSQALQSIFGGYGGTNGQGGVTYNAQGFVSQVYAKGGVVDGSRNLSAYSGQVVDRPTLFAFAKGNGLMGEAGPEAIMPLRRGPDGRLGVAAQSGGSGDVQVEVNITNNGQDVQAKQTGTRRDGQKVIVDMVLEAVANDMATGGRTAKAAQQRFGLQRRGVPVSGA